MINSQSAVTGIPPVEAILHYAGQENYNFWDRLCDSNTLRLAWLKVKQNGGSPGVDGITIHRFETHLERNLSFIQSHLHHYQPLPYLRIYIEAGNGKKRALDIPCVRDRIVLKALLMTLAAEIDKHTPINVFGYRYGMGAQAAVKKAEQLIGEGNIWAFRSDIRNFFGSIERARLMEHLTEIIPDERILRLINKFLNAGTKENSSITFPDKGIAQGSCLSPLLSNVYLRPFDTAMMNAGYHMLRYADDILALVPTKALVSRAALLDGKLLTDFGLELNETKTTTTHISRGIEFLGFAIDAGGRMPGANAVARLNRRIEQINQDRAMRIHKKVEKLRQMIRGWLNYFGTGTNITVNDRLGFLVFRQTKLELENRASHYRLPEELRDEVAVYLTAKKRLAEANAEVRRIETHMRANWKDNIAAKFYLRRILSHA